VQNYSVENHLHWMRENKPSLGVMQIYMPDNLEWINRQYKQTLADQFAGDALMAIAAV